MKAMRNFATLAIASALLAPSLVTADERMMARNTDPANLGRVEFQMNCAACHGSDGKGNGPFQDFLKQAPADLTQIRQRNGGQFPFRQVYTWIEDPGSSRAHGNADMPVWGARYSNEIIRKYGLFDMEHPSNRQARILSLVYYLTTIQE